jgi:uncharacterized Zn finger protein (UPF0148 family)
MSDKKVAEKRHCEECDSPYKLIYSEDEVSHNDVYCPFCGEELNFDRDDGTESDEDFHDNIDS